MDSSDKAPALSADAEAELAAALERSDQLQRELAQLNQRIRELNEQVGQSGRETRQQ